MPLGVVVSDPAADDVAGVGQALEPVLPDTFLLQAADETLDQAVLFGRIGRDRVNSGTQTILTIGNRLESMRL